MSLLIFDLDGTIVDCKELHRAAFRYAVETCAPGAKFDDSEVEARSTLDKIKVLQQKNIIIDNRVDLVKKEYTRQNIEKYVKFDEEMHDVFKRLASKHKLAVASNSRMEYVLKCLSILDLWQLDIVFCRDHGPPKPNPWMFTECMRITNSEPSGSWIFEDSPVGIQAALRSGANVIPVDGSEDLKRKLNEF